MCKFGAYQELTYIFMMIDIFLAQKKRPGFGLCTKHLKQNHHADAHGRTFSSSRAEYVPARVFKYQGLIVSLHVSAHIEG
jgi:hypothetical protein